MTGHDPFLAELGPDPLAAFDRWHAEAHAADEPEPDAVALATVDARGVPDVRYVLVKGRTADGVRFFTNYESAKAEALEQTGVGSIAVAWLTMHRQIRLRGTVDRLDGAASDEYFASRDRRSQIGAWASPQSRPLRDREELVELFDAIEAHFGDEEIPRPDHWGGYVLVPDEVEFWAGQRHRLHDRVRYTRLDGHWGVQRLAP